MGGLMVLCLFVNADIISRHHVEIHARRVCFPHRHIVRAHVGTGEFGQTHSDLDGFDRRTRPQKIRDDEEHNEKKVGNFHLI